MSLNFGNKTFADVSWKSVSGRFGVGNQGLQFVLQLHMHEWKAPYLWLKNLSAMISVSGSGNLGIATAEQTFIARNFEYSNSTYPVLYLDLSREQIEELERIRGGRDLSFALLLSAEVLGATEPSFVSDQFTVHVNQSNWLAILREMRYSDVLLYEVKQPLKSDLLSEEYQHLHKSLRDAQKHYEVGQYNDAVADCRMAFEQIEKIHPRRQETKVALQQYCSDSRKDREAMNAEQRALIIKEAIRNYTHLTHHPDGEGRAPSLTRSEAGMILGCTYSVIACLATEATKSS